MATVTELNDRKKELEERIDTLTGTRSELEREITSLIEMIPVVVMQKQAELLESTVGTLRSVKELLQSTDEYLERSSSDQGPEGVARN
jgi:prefoldin subunit 5